MSPYWHRFDDTETIAQYACTQILTMAQQAITTRGSFHLVVTGGNSPVPTFKLLKSACTDWSKWHIYYADERGLPLQHEQRNSYLVEQIWLNDVAIPVLQHHLLPAMLQTKESIQTVAAEYAQVIRPVLPFDLVLLGLGEDGHVASLFPGRSYPANQLVHPVVNSPKPPPERISLSVEALSQCRQMLILVTGVAKHQALMAWQGGERLPVAQLDSAQAIEVLIDQAAWSGVDSMPTGCATPL